MFNLGIYLPLVVAHLYAVDVFISHNCNKITSNNKITSGNKITMAWTTRQKLSADYNILRLQDLLARRAINPSQSPDASYWLSAAAAGVVAAKMHEAEIKLAIEEWKKQNDDRTGNTIEWWSTQEARYIVLKLQAAVYEKKLYMQQAEKIQRGGPGAPQSMFTTSQVGLGVQKTDVGKRSKSQQSKFKQAITRAYDAAATDPKKPEVITELYDSATGNLLFPEHIRAAYIVPHLLGPDVLIALFGSNVEGELDTPYNGLLLQTRVEKAMDDGAIAIVPDLPDNPSTEQVATWESTEPKEYRWRVIDDKAEIVDQKFEGGSGMKIRDLSNKRLFFKNNVRPRARYLYFLFIVAQLKLAWRHDYCYNPADVLKKQLGWGVTKDRYLKRAFLLALSEEIGHGTQLCDNIPTEPKNDDNPRNDNEPADDNEPRGDNNPDETGVIAIAKLLRFRKRNYEDDEEYEEDEDEDDEDYYAFLEI